MWGGSDLSRKEAPQPTPSEAQRRVFFLHNNLLNDFAYASRLQRVWFGQQCSCFDRSSNTFICHQYKVTVPVHTRSPLQLSWYEEDYVQPLANIIDLLCSFHALNYYYVLGFYELALFL